MKCLGLPLCPSSTSSRSTSRVVSSSTNSGRADRRLNWRRKEARASLFERHPIWGLGLDILRVPD